MSRYATRIRHEGEDREGDEGEPPVHDEHGRHDEEEGDQVAEYRHHPRAEEIVQRLHVGGDPRHEPSDGVSVVEPQIEPLEVREDLAPEVAHHALAEPRRHEHLPVLEPEGDDGARHVCDGEESDEPPVRGGHGLVERDLHEPGADDLHRRERHEERHGRDHLPAVGLEVAEEPAHEDAVVRLAERLLFLDGPCDLGCHCLLPGCYGTAEGTVLLTLRRTPPLVDGSGSQACASRVERPAIGSGLAGRSELKMQTRKRRRGLLEGEVSVPRIRSNTALGMVATMTAPPCHGPPGVSPDP